MTINEYPALIEAANLELYEAGKELDEERERLARYEAGIKVQILTARNEAGKPLYSNDALRDAAFTEAIADDDRHQQLRVLADGAELEKFTAAAKLDRLRAEFRIALIEYEAERLGRRSAA